MGLVAHAVAEADDNQAVRLRTGVHDAVVGSGVGGRHEVLICTTCLRAGSCIREKTVPCGARRTRWLSRARSRSCVPRAPGRRPALSAGWPAPRGCRCVPLRSPAVRTGGAPGRTSPGCTPLGRPRLPRSEANRFPPTGCPEPAAARCSATATKPPSSSRPSNEGWSAARQSDRLMTTDFTVRAARPVDADRLAELRWMFKQEDP